MPTIGDRVDVGCGACLLGEVQIGEDAAIGANAVILVDVPPGALAVGVPARIIPRRDFAANVNGTAEANVHAGGG